MRLVDVYIHDGEWACKFVYELLAQRESHESISHRRMPTWNEHCAFFYSKPYLHWWIIMDESWCEEGFAVGAAYISKNHEIGIAISKDRRRQGHAKKCIKMILDRFSGTRLLANINPKNEASANLFKSLGFGLIQHTYSHE